MTTENNFNQASSGSSDARPGPFLATVVGHQDPTFMGTIEVELLRPTGNNSDETALHQVKYMSPFYGVTSAAHIGANNDYASTQKSYGFWMVPPDVGTTVVVIFIDGDPRRGFWIGCVQDQGMNFMLPGLAATQKVEEDVEADKAGRYGRVPVAEYNKKVTGFENPDGTQTWKPKHPLADALDRQGLLFDDARGITTSSARREVPSMVFGISTPGPVDKRNGAPRGRIGKEEWKIDNAFVGRLGGSTFVMDDGDARYLRKKTAGEGPPEYASLENDESDGNVEIPHNELIRLRTRTGHQILLHNSEDLIYVGNAKGTAWIELTSNGKIDIYAKDSISVHTENDLNFTADRDINMTAKGNINLNSTGLTNLTAKTNINLNSAGNNNFTTTGITNINSGGNHVETAAQIHMNGPQAAKSVKAPPAVRVPQAEPWKSHENLDPTLCTPDKTKAIVPAVGANPAPVEEVQPDLWKTYSTGPDDTFTVRPPMAT